MGLAGWPGLGSLMQLQPVAAVCAGQVSFSSSFPLWALPFGLSVWAGWASSQHGGAQSSRDECPKRTLQKLHCIF